jgi:hypothetical protein
MRAVERGPSRPARRGVSRAIVIAALLSVSCASLPARRQASSVKPARADVQRTAVLARAQVWQSVDVRRADLLAGPRLSNGFARGATVTCDYLDKKLSGLSPKFACRMSNGDELKVKYGGANGEVYGELLATRLLWALGFGADAMYPVNVICRGCPQPLGGIERPGGEYRFDPAVVERKLAGAEWPEKDESGWSWQELAETTPARGGAPKAQRDALTLLAVFMQHTDSKPQQQRILCLGGVEEGACSRPFLMVSDVGLTFGTASLTNANDVSGANLERWRTTPVWRDETGCVGNLDKSFSGTLHRPVISEAGRRFLAVLLQQLSDAQLHDLFEVARVNLRVREPGRALSGFPAIDEWVAAFKQKRDEVVAKRCA